MKAKNETTEKWEEFSEKISAKFSLPVETILLSVNALAISLLIVLHTLEVLPFSKTGNFVFFAILSFLFALWRPRWAFWFFVGVLPLEIITLSPVQWPLAVRPYQLLGASLFAALVVRALTGRLPRKCFRWRWPDTAVLVICAGGFLAAWNAPDFSAALKQAVIVSTFVLWYFLTRYFVRGPVSLVVPLKFLLVSATAVSLYGLWQNYRFTRNLEVVKIMPGRANATFAEPDWLGMFSAFVSVVLLASFYYGLTLSRRRKKETFFGNRNCFSDYMPVAAWLSLTTVLTALILTVSRSAWLSVAAGIGFFFLLVSVVSFLKKKNHQVLLPTLGGFFAAFFLALFLIKAVGLSDFELGKRLASTGGKQEITVSCPDSEIAEKLQKFVGDLPDRKLSSIEELQKFNCRHINLEEIDAEKSAGNTVLKVPRQDPSIAVRADIYQQTWQIIRQNWLGGIGWGSVGEFLGKDEHGNYLNSSNIFWQVWLGSGLAGFLAFVALVSTVFYSSLQRTFRAERERNFIFAAGISAGLVSLLAANFFNAGLLTAWVWVFLAVAVNTIKNK